MGKEGLVSEVITVGDFIRYVEKLLEEGPRTLERDLVVHDSSDRTETEVVELVNVDFATIGLKI